MPSVAGLPPSVFGAPAAEAPAEDDLGRDTFLRLLTTQLQNQDPSEPLSNEEFIAQLATFTNVEQMMGMNETMETAAMGIAALNNTSMANLLGTEVTAVTDQFPFSGEGDVSLHYDASADAAEVRVDIFDADGRLVRSEPIGAITAGQGSWTWDGRDENGVVAEEGTYRFSVVASDDTPIDTLLIGVVDEMDYTAGNPRPSVNGVPVDIGAILRLQHPD